MKYITVTLNPVTDRTYTLSSPLKAGEINRTEKMSDINYSGKGINVSRELYRLGVDSKVMCILQGDEGETAYRSLVNEELNLFSVKCGGRMRNNIEIIAPDGAGYEVNEPGDEVKMEDVVNFLSMYDTAVSAKNEKTVIISGSIPPGFRKDIYKMLILNAKKNGAKTVLDADGELLRIGMEAHPDLIKPNLYELSHLVGREIKEKGEAARKEALEAAAMIYEKTGVCVLCTLGEDGSVYVGDEGRYECEAKRVKIKRFKGAGDMYLARFIYETRENGVGIEEAMKAASESTAERLSAE